MATEPPGSPKMDYPLKVSAFGGFSFEGEDFSFHIPPSTFHKKSFLENSFLRWTTKKGPHK
jgi:hypothetical protein